MKFSLMETVCFVEHSYSSDTTRPFLREHITAVRLPPITEGGVSPRVAFDCL